MKIKLFDTGHELYIQFSSSDELEKKLSELEIIIDLLIKSQLIMKISPKKPLEQYKELYTYTSDGKLRLLRFPEQKADTIRLALFLAEQSLSLDEIREITGIDNPRAYMKGGDFVELRENIYTLSPEGRKKVVDEIIPNLLGGR
ncbi:MAG: hypothetical protein QXH49_02505 [Nitrososphaerota archaeon]